MSIDHSKSILKQKCEFKKAYDEVIFIVSNLDDDKIANMSPSEKGLFRFMRDVSFEGDLAYTLKNYSSSSIIYRHLLNEAKKYKVLMNV